MERLMQLIKVVVSKSFKTIICMFLSMNSISESQEVSINGSVCNCYCRLNMLVFNFKGEVSYSC